MYDQPVTLTSISFVMVQHEEERPKNNIQKVNTSTLKLAQHPTLRALSANANSTTSMSHCSSLERDIHAETYSYARHTHLTDTVLSTDYSLSVT